MTLAQRVRKSWWPLGPASLLMPAITIVVVTVATTGPMLRWPYPLWVQTSAQFHQQATWAGLIAGTSACWYATVLHPQDRIWAQPQAPRMGHLAVTYHLTTLIGWLVGAYLVALLPLVVSTVIAGGIGASDPLAMSSGVFAMVAAVAVGYTAGTVMPSKVTVPIVAAGFYALLVIGSAGGERYATVTPALYREPELGQRESLPLQVFRIALFILITAAAASLAGKSLNRTATSTTQLWPRIIDVGTHALAPIALVAISLIHPPVVFATDNQPASSCTKQHAIRYCVHANNQPRLADLVRAVDPIIVRFGTKPDNLDQIWDQALTLHPINADLAHSLDIVWLNPDGTIQTQVAATIAGIHACSHIASDDRRSEKDIERLTQATTDISNYLTTGTAVGTLSAMPAADIQQWIAEHQQQLHTCTLTPDQLPDTQTR